MSEKFIDRDYLLDSFKDYNTGIVKPKIDEINSNLDRLGYGENIGGRNIFQLDKIKCGSMVENDLVLANQDSEFYEYNWKPNTQYTISFVGRNSTSNGMQRLYFEYTDGSASEQITNAGTSFDYVSATSEVGKTIKSLKSYWGNNGSLIIKDAEIMIEEGTQATPYEPYIPSVKMLASENAQQNTESMDLKMLGWTVPRQLSHLTSIDSNNVYHCKVGRKAMWECNWTYNEGGTNLFYSSDFYDGKTGGMCVYLKYDGITGGNFKDNWGIHLNEASYNVTYINALGYTDAEALKQLLKNENVYLYYELKTPITMNIDGNEAVTKVNESLSYYGFVAKEYVSNDFSQGLDTNGNITSNNYYVCNKNIISANAGDTITVKSIANSESYVAFYDGSTFKSVISIPTSSINNFVFSIPSGSNGFRISIGVNIGVTPSTIGEVKIYINNAIDELKNDLIKYQDISVANASYAFHDKSNTKLTIPDGYSIIGCSIISGSGDYTNFIPTANKDYLTIVSTYNGTVSMSFTVRVYLLKTQW